ncbi:MAG: MCE family protein [Jatrophihabitans sp.]|uniref:MCE family protein n=1 Tax=Jatrophihabitans sp. TaxID=1932789 RepID=UPI003F815530
MERIRNRPLEIVLGLLLAAALVIGVGLIWLSFRGDLGDYYTVDAHLSQASDALEQGDPVSFRNVIVGEVSDTSGSLDGTAVARLRLHADQARLIPATVTAIALPRTLFGAVQIELLPPARDGDTFLHDGGTIAPATGPQAESLQTALANAYRLLTSIHPAQLDAALSALASALDGQGDRLGRLVTSADRYLRAIAPHMGQLAGVIGDLATVTDGLARNAPDLLGSLRNLLVVTKGITAQKRAIAELLAVAPTAVDDTQLLLSPRNVDNIVTVFRDQVPVSAALAADPHALVDTIDGFRAFGQAFSSAASSGPYLKTNILLTGVDVAELFPIIAGGEGHAFDGIDDPPVYTGADCPRYGDRTGPNCGARAATARARVLTTGTSYGGTADSVGSRRELDAVRAAASALTGLPTASIPDAADLLLGPLLRGSATVIAP